MLLLVVHGLQFSNSWQVEQIKHFQRIAHSLQGILTRYATFEGLWLGLELELGWCAIFERLWLNLKIMPFVDRCGSCPSRFYQTVSRPALDAFHFEPLVQWRKERNTGSELFKTTNKGTCVTNTYSLINLFNELAEFVMGRSGQQVKLFSQISIFNFNGILN